jgi:hypothetical protein
MSLPSPSRRCLQLDLADRYSGKLRIETMARHEFSMLFSRGFYGLAEVIVGCVWLVMCMAYSPLCILRFACFVFFA